MQMSRLMVWSTAFSDDERSETEYRLSADETPLTLSGLPPENRDNSRDNIRTKHFIIAKIHIFTQRSKRNQHRNRSGTCPSGTDKPPGRRSAGATVVLTPAAMAFTLGSIPADVTNLKLVIQASDPQGNGITRASSKAAAFDDPSTPVATAVDIKAKYDAKCGTPSAGSPKVFFKYFFVNTVTGEKSGDVLAQAKLTGE